MTDREIQFISALSAGAVAPVSIRLARTTRKRIMRKLERQGYTVRADRKWKLTKAGWRLAIVELGITPAIRYELPAEDLGGVLATIDEAIDRVSRGDSSMIWILRRGKRFAARATAPMMASLSAATAMTLADSFKW